MSTKNGPRAAGGPAGALSEALDGDRLDGSLPPGTIERAGMTRGERDDLVRIARLRAKVARSRVGQREAELLADVEEQLSAVYAADHEAWAAVTAAAQTAVDQADRHVAERCRELGIDPEFRPGLSVHWYGRGENAVASRRAELRKRAQTRIAAVGKAAKVAIEAAEAEVLTELLASSLTSDEARTRLTAMPTAETLMPALAVAELEAGAR